MSDETDLDYGSDGDPDDTAVAAAFALLDKLTLQAERVIQKRKQLEEALQKAKDAERQLIEREIPELLEKMHLDKCTTSSGIEVSVKRDIRASLPGHERAEARAAAFRWLIDNGHGGIIKNQVSVALERGEDDRADALVVELRGKGFDVESKKDVHPSTLSALARELMEAGKTGLNKVVNFFDQRSAKLSRRE